MITYSRCKRKWINHVICEGTTLRSDPRSDPETYLIDSFGGYLSRPHDATVKHGISRQRFIRFDSIRFIHSSRSETYRLIILWRAVLPLYECLASNRIESNTARTYQIFLKECDQWIELSHLFEKYSSSTRHTVYWISSCPTKTNESNYSFRVY